MRVYDRITYNYPPLPPPEDPRSDNECVGITAVSLAQATPVVEPAWDIRVRGGVFNYAIVGLPGEGLTEMWQIDLIRGDVNADGEVNCRDFRIIKRALWSSRRSRSKWRRARWNPACDLNRDGRVTLRDLRIAFCNYGKVAEWEPLEIVEVTDTLIFGRTDHFSIFRGR